MKPPIPIYLAVEDDLSEGILRRLLQLRPVEYAVGTVFKKGGFGYLKKQTPAFNNLAKGCPVLLLTDLDARPCAPDLLKEWLAVQRHKDFLLRVAVHEVEAWLLASGAGFGAFLGIRKDCSIEAPEELSDPKEMVLRIATSCPKRDIRDALVRRDSSGCLKQGPAYNSALVSFVNNTWNPQAAESVCPSLKRMMAALGLLEESWRQRL